ncbi:hypothetical protein D3C72_1724800 [compost metagenome]
MEGGVEAGDLGQLAVQSRKGTHHGQAGRLVQWCQRNQLCQVVDHFRGQHHRAGVAVAAMHHAVRHRHRFQSLVGEDIEHRRHRFVAAAAGQRHPRLAAAVVQLQAGAGGTETVDEAACQQLHAVRLVGTEFQRGGAGIDGDESLAHYLSFFVGGKDVGHRRRGQPSGRIIGTAGQHDRHPGAHHDAGTGGGCQIGQLLGQHIA